MRFPWQRYYVKEKTQDELVGLFGEQYWIGHGSNYEQGYLEHPEWRLKYFRELADEVLKRKPGSVLEVGCARGDVIKLVQEAGVYVTGIDISTWAVEHRVITQVCRGRAQELPFADKSFDLYFAHDVFEHIPVQDILQVANEMRRVAQRALLIISCESLVDDVDPTHVTMKPLSWWREHLCWNCEYGCGRAPFPLEILHKPHLSTNTGFGFSWETLVRACRRLWLP